MGMLQNLMIKLHKRTGDRFQGMNLLYLTTTGAQSGRQRRTPVARFADGDGWLVVASNNGRARHPGWYHNIRAHPDQVWAEVSGRNVRVRAEKLDGPQRDAAWQQITAAQPRFAGYQRKTQRALPILRLSPTEPS